MHNSVAFSVLFLFVILFVCVSKISFAFDLCAGYLLLLFICYCLLFIVVGLLGVLVVGVFAYYL